jgi:nanoRNase/pAp phosphatase (c-di-AMP/oligoRNAs hydrolase)
MSDSLDFSQISQPLVEAKSILILIAADPNLDQVAAGLGLYLSLKKRGKSVAIGCPSEMTVAFNRLIGIDKVANKIGNRNLVISFDYIKDSIEKVSYNIEDDKFNLIVEPKPNFPPLDTDKVDYSYSGVDADLVFMVGASKLEDLGKFYNTNKKLFNEKMTVNIDSKHNNTRFGKINLYNAKAASCSEIVAKLLKITNLAVDKDIATNLYGGIKTSTSNFQSPNVSPATFEAAAWCLENGAQKTHFTVSQTNSQSFPVKPADELKPFISSPAPVAPQPVKPFKETVKTSPSQVQSPQSQTPPPPFTVSDQLNNNEDEKGKQPPPDWFKPKIYRGNSNS